MTKLTSADCGAAAAEAAAEEDTGAQVMFECRPNIVMGTLICSHYYLLMLTAFVHKFGPSLIRLWKHNSDREDREDTDNERRRWGRPTDRNWYKGFKQLPRRHQTLSNRSKSHPPSSSRDPRRPSCIFRLRFDDRGPNQKPIVCMPGSLSGKSLLQQQIWKGEQRVCPL